MNPPTITVGLLGFGKAGQAVARVLAHEPGLQLRWIARRHAQHDERWTDQAEVRMLGLADQDMATLLDDHPVDALVDFSHPDAVLGYAEVVRQRRLMVVSAISAYSGLHLNCLRQLGEHTRILSSPNITLGINFLLMAARLLRDVAPFADVEIVEQHFRGKPEVSGTARVLANGLSLGEERITSLRLGGIVGHHEVIFGFPHQTVRLSHESIRREAFGTGAAFALRELAQRDNGFYTFDDLLMRKIRGSLLKT